jgi:hypothetical protein
MVLIWGIGSYGKSRILVVVVHDDYAAVGEGW